MSNLYIPLNIQRFGGSWGFNQAYAYDYNVSNNTNWIYCQIYISTNSTTYNQTGNAYCTLTATASNGGGNYSQTQYYNIAKGSTVYLDFWMGPFTHNADGTLPSISLGGHIYVTSNTQFDISGNIYPSTIARYFTETPSISSANITETGFKVNWTTSETRDWSQYSLNGGGWTDAGDSGNKSGTINFSGLNANTTYTVKCRFRRADSGLWSESNQISVTTYAYPYITGASNFTVGNANTITFYNPLSRNITIHVQPNGSGTWYGGDTSTGTSISGYNNSGWRDIWYQNKTNGTSNTYRVRLTYGSQTNTTGYDYKYTISESANSGEAKPTFSNFTCQDTNSSIVALTGDSSKVVLGYSNITSTISTSNKATANKYASMSSYKMIVGSKNTTSSYSSSNDITMTINNVASNSVSVTAYDSRGFSRNVTKSLTNVGYTAPVIDTLNATLTRSNNNVGENVTLSFGGTYWNGNFGVTTNTIKTLTYNYKTTSDSNWHYAEGNEPSIINDMTTSGNTFSYNHLISGPTSGHGFDISTTYNVKVNYSDELSSGSFILTLGSGTPNLAISEKGVAINQKYDDENDAILQVNGKTYINGTTNITGDLSNTGTTTTNGNIYIGGYIYHKNISTGTNTRISTIIKGSSLYSNNDGTTGTITLSYDLTNYYALDIVCGNSFGKWTIRAYHGASVGKNSKFINVFNVSINQSDTRYAEIAGTLYTATSTALTPSTNSKGSIIFNATTLTLLPATSQQNFVKIFKIIGYSDTAI